MLPGIIQALPFALCGASLALALDVAIPLSPPATANRIAGDHVSFSLEQDRWLDWSGTTSRNDFFFNTLDNLRQLSGVPPQIRIGANSQDRTNFNPGIDVDTRVIWGLNLGQNNLTAGYLVSQSITKAFELPEVRQNGIVLDGMIIGNEPDLFPVNGHRSPGYSVSQYISEWKAIASNVTTTLKITSSSNTKFWGAAFAASSHSNNGFSPQALFYQGLLTSPPGSLISTISQHAYSGSFCEGNGALLQDLMTKAYIRGNLSRFTPDIAATRAQNLDYVMGETNSFACHGTPGVSNVGGAALWTLDYLLYGAQVGISRIFFHQGIGFKYNLIQPVALTRSPLDATPLSSPLPPHVQPQYYAAILAAEAIGPSGSTRVSELSVGDARISGYAFYEGNALVRAVFINSLAFYAGDKPETRRSTRINLSFSGSQAGGSVKSFTVKRLDIPYADAETGLKWGGITYETSNGRPQEAVLLSFNR
ncbi:hypothetical protein H1R20_g15470, partial [Candolleomyces eurysporus]